MAHPALEPALVLAARVRDVYSLREIYDDVFVIYEGFSLLFLSLSSPLPPSHLLSLATFSIIDVVLSHSCARI